MHLAPHAIILFALALPLPTPPPAAQTSSSPLPYPQAKPGAQVDDYHGVKVSDPYRWLEDTDSADTHAWVEAENKLTFSYLDPIPYRKALPRPLTKLANYEPFSAPQHESARD